MTDDPVVDEGVDWEAIDREDEDTTPTGDDTASPSPDEDEPQGGDKPPAKKPGEDTQSPQPDDPPKPKPDDGEQRPKPEGEDTPSPQPQETEEQRVAREKQTVETAAKVFNDLKEYYKLPDDAVERLRTEPELVLPELAAKMHQAVFQGMQQWSMQTIPMFLQQHAQIQEANQRSRSAFYERWPSLQKHEKEVLQVGRMFREMNPNATPQERLEKVGQLACAALGLTPDPKPGGQQPPAGQGKQPQQQARRTAPMRPANPSGGTGAAPPPSDNVFEGLAEEFLEEDRGQ